MCWDKCNLIIKAEIRILETKQKMEVEMEFPPDISSADERICYFMIKILWATRSLLYEARAEVLKQACDTEERQTFKEHYVVPVVSLCDCGVIAWFSGEQIGLWRGKEIEKFEYDPEKINKAKATLVFYLLKYYRA